MAGQKFLIRDSGRTKQANSAQSSAGAGDAGKLVALNSGGVIDPTMLPPGVGPSIIQLDASEALSAGNFVNIWNDGGTAKVRLADNSNGRVAHGFVLDAVDSSDPADVYPLDEVNSALTSLTVGGDYWLGTSGAATATPLDATDAGNANKVCQYLGKAISATEISTVDDGYVVL